MSRIFINGRFLAAPQTGVQRVARELVKAIDRRLADGDAMASHDWTLLAPTGVSAPALSRIGVRDIGGGGGALWEQTRLAAAARGGLLLNFANTGPLFHVPSIVMMHDAQVHDAPQSYSPAFRCWYRLLQPLLARRASAVLTVSSHSRDRLAANRVADPGKIVVSLNSGEHILRTDANAPPVAEPPYVFAFASAAAHKNVGLLLQAFADPRLQTVRLALAGAEAPPDYAPERYANVTMVGRRTDAEIASLIRNADCLLLPSRTEGFGLPALEAMSLGCPVIAADAGALPEVCGDAAILLDPDDAPAWTAAIAGLCADESARRRLSQAGLARAAQFTWERSARTVLDVAARALAG